MYAGQYVDVNSINNISERYIAQHGPAQHTLLLITIKYWMERTNFILTPPLHNYFHFKTLKINTSLCSEKL